jgi:branched-chain amino acid transport system permease protein
VNWGLVFSPAIFQAISANAVAYVLVAIGLNVHFGYTGLLNFGQAGFAAVGAYGVAIPISRYDWPWPFALLVAFGAAVLLALLLGIPTLRLRADYLAIVTIAAAEIIRLCANSVRFTWLVGGNDGLQGFSDWLRNMNPFKDGNGTSLWKQKITAYQLWMMVVGWALVAIVAAFVYLLMRSPWGRVLKSIREDEDAARSLGKNVFAYKMKSLVIGGVIGAIGGLWLVLDKGSSQPGDFSTTLTFFAFTMVVLGGAGTTVGPIVGAMLFLFITNFVDRFLAQATAVTRQDPDPILPRWLVKDSNFGQVKYIMAGLLLALLVIFRPQGIFGNKREQAFDVR